MRPSTPTFGDRLGGPESRELREKLSALAEGHTGPLRVDTLFGAWSGLGGEQNGEPTSYLLLDLHRLFLYQEPEEEDGPKISSIVRFIVDGYPFQPFDLLANHLYGRPDRFLYSLETLDLLPVFWVTRKPGTLTTLNLSTGEITHSVAQLHPHARPIRRSGIVRSPPAGLELRERLTDGSLRAGSAVGLDDLVSPVAAPVRELITVSNHASLPFAVARVMWNQGKQKEFCGGKSLRPDEAALVATCEALERFHAAFQSPDEDLVHGTYAELHEYALDPRTFFFGQFPPPADSRVPVFTDETRLYWTWVFDPSGGPPVLVPAQEVWFTTSRLLGERYYVEPNTNGYALGGSVEEAAMFSLLEAIERDAYLTTWYLRRPCAQIDPDSIRYEPFQLLRRRWHAAYPDYALHLFDISTDIAVPTVAAIAVRQRNRGPRTFHAAAARLSAERACFAALKDLTGFTSNLAPGRLDEMRRLLDEPEQIHGPSGHFELYSLDETFERLSFLDFDSRTRIEIREMDERALLPSTGAYDLGATIGALTEHLRPLGISVYLKDITHPSLSARGLRCVKAVTPGLYPIWFGSRLKRFAVTDRLRRLARDLAGRALTEPEDFNLEIHPFS